MTNIGLVKDQMRDIVGEIYGDGDQSPFARKKPHTDPNAKSAKASAANDVLSKHLPGHKSGLDRQIGDIS